MPGSGGRLSKARWPSQCQGPLSRCLRSSEVPLGSLCSGNRTPCLVRGEWQGMSLRAFHERNFTISHSSFKHPSCGILPCHEVKEFALLFSLSFFHGKTSHQDCHGQMFKEVWELPSWIRQGLYLAPCHVSGGDEHLSFMGGSRNLAGSSYLIKFSREEIFL